MAVKKGLVGVLAAIGAAMLFLASAAGAMMGGMETGDKAAVGKGNGPDGLGSVGSGSEAAVADNSLEGYVVDNATGEGISDATVIIIHIPENVSDAGAYVDRVLSALRRARESFSDRREKLEARIDQARQMDGLARERLERANETLCEKKERLHDAAEAAKERPGSAGRYEMKRIENGMRKVAEAEKRLETARQRLESSEAKARERLRKAETDFKNDVAAFIARLASRGIFVVRTGEDGRFESEVPGGTDVIVAVAPGYYQGRLAVELPLADESAQTLRLAAKPGREVYRLKFVWGYLDEANPDGTFAAWNGSIAVSDGAVRLLRTVQFERGGRFASGGNDKVYPQNERDTLSWRSSTTVARDGVVVLVIVPAGAEHVELTLNAGQWSKTVRLARLEGEDFRIQVGDAGHEILVACELLDRPVM